MGFKMKYDIKKDYLPIKHTSPRRRAGILMPRVGFIVAHDTGNYNSTAQGNVSYYKRTHGSMSASAHLFVDDKEIIECIPAVTQDPEKAWHVLYGKILDNKIYGDDANDIAIGVEYCFGGNIDADESYKRYVWVMAYICYLYELDPAKAIIGHEIIDPGRKVDPSNGLSYSGRTYQQLLEDVVIEYHNCLEEEGEKLNLQHDWQWDMLVNVLKALHNKGQLHSSEWAEKAEKRELSLSELSFLNIVLLERITSPKK